MYCTANSSVGGSAVGRSLSGNRLTGCLLANIQQVMEELMSEEYRKFDAADYVKTEEDVRGFSERLRKRILGTGQ